jgi:hypothetical protein
MWQKPKPAWQFPRWRIEAGVPSSAFQFSLLVLKRSARNAIYEVKDKKPRLKG